MERTIVKIQPEWNGSHANLECDYDLFGWSVIPERFADVWTANKPFVNIEVDSEGAIINMTAGEEKGMPIDILIPQKLAELSRACSDAILNGCDVELSDCSGHISLTAEDQINLTNAIGAVQGGALAYPYHLDGQLCRFYPAEDILKMGEAATAHKLYHTTYYNHLATWVKRCSHFKEIEAIYYGAQLPEDLNTNMVAILGAMNND